MLKHKTRSLMTNKKRGLIPFSKTLLKHPIGSKVVIRPLTENVKTAPHRRYCGKIGIIRKKLGRGYLLYINNKKICTTGEHLKPL